jgi:hypothetical protein
MYYFNLWDLYVCILCIFYISLAYVFLGGEKSDYFRPMFNEGTPLSTLRIIRNFHMLSSSATVTITFNLTTYPLRTPLKQAFAFYVPK